MSMLQKLPTQCGCVCNLCEEALWNQSPGEQHTETWSRWSPHLTWSPEGHEDSTISSVVDCCSKNVFPLSFELPSHGNPSTPIRDPAPTVPGFPPPVPPGTPMSPVPMNIMAAAAPKVLVPTVSMVGKHLGIRKDYPGLKTKEDDENCDPTTTVFLVTLLSKPWTCL